jgi:signal transduction histidine kinase
VFPLAMTRDRTGRSYLHKDIVPLLAANSTVPLFSIYRVWIGTGIVGGSITSAEDDARVAADIARRLLAGENPMSISAAPSPPSRCTIDYRAVEHWRLDASLVPSPCRVLFRQPSFLQRYADRIGVGTVVLVVFSVLLSALLVQRARRRLAEAEARRRSEELAHASRLAAAGQLTASITHEMNQPLTAILSNAEAGAVLLAQEHPPLEEIRKILEDIRDADIRAAEYIKQLRNLLTRRPITLQPVDVNEVVTATARLLERVAKSHGVVIDLRLREGLPHLSGDRVHLQQAILNLMMNAVEAMAATPGDRRLTIATAVDEHDRLIVTLRDTGPGIAADRLATIFEPFHTTKAQGMGLGLSLVRSIVQAHGGMVWAEANAGGATFHFAIPVPTGTAPLVADGRSLPPDDVDIQPANV